MNGHEAAMERFDDFKEFLSLVREMTWEVRERSRETWRLIWLS